MGFEYDKEKSSANKRKHGIDFDEAQTLWNDLNRLELPAESTNEPRYLCIGLIEGKHWTAVITYRGETTRLISIRRARKEEVEWYESI